MKISCNCSIEFILEKIGKSFKDIDLWYYQKNGYSKSEETYRNFLDSIQVHEDGLVSIFIDGDRIDIDENGNIKKSFMPGGLYNGICLLRKEKYGHRYVIGYSDFFNVAEGRIITGDHKDESK